MLHGDGTSGTTVANLLAVIDPTRFIVASHAFDSSARIERVAIAEAGRIGQVRRGDAILAIGADPEGEDFAELVRSCSNAGVSLIACRATVPTEQSGLTALARAYAVCIISLHADVTWEDLNARFRLILTDGLASRSVGQRTPPNSDLFSLADTAATLLDAAVIIDDENLEVVAYSTYADAVDEARRKSIDSLRAEPAVITWLNASGAIARVRHSPEPCVVHVPQAMPRWVTAIRAGSAIVGFIWVATLSELTPQMSMLLSEIARRAAPILARAQLDRDPHWNSRSFALREALLDNISAERLAQEIPVDEARPARVLGFRAMPGRGADPAIVSALHSMTSLLLNSESRTAVVVAHGDTVFALALETDPHTGHDADLAWLIAQRAARRFAVPVHGAIGPFVNDGLRLLDGLRAIPRLHAISAPDADRTLVVDYEDHRESLILDELLRFMGGKPHLLWGPIHRLWLLDRTRGTDYTRTLRTFLMCQSDTTLAAHELNVHRNTLKYRLGRIRDIVGTDFLATSESRVIALLQSHILLERLPSARAVTAEVELSQEAI